MMIAQKSGYGFKSCLVVTGDDQVMGVDQSGDQHPELLVSLPLSSNSSSTALPPQKTWPKALGESTSDQSYFTASENKALTQQDSSSSLNSTVTSSSFSSLSTNNFPSNKLNSAKVSTDIAYSSPRTRGCFPIKASHLLDRIRIGKSRQTTISPNIHVKIPISLSAENNYSESLDNNDDYQFISAELKSLPSTETLAVMDESEPLLSNVKDTSIDPHFESKSTNLQSSFNSLNILVGIATFSLPFAFKLTGWILGISFMLLSALITMYTALILSKCLDFIPKGSMLARLPVGSHLRTHQAQTFGDIGELAFGPLGRAIINSLFMLELGAACVGLVILCADSICNLIPALQSYPSLTKAGLVFFVLMPCTIPKSFRFTSYGSIIGIISFVLVLGSMLFQGLTLKTGPGSLLSPSSTYLFPSDWSRVPLTFGLIMAGFSGHSVFPSIYRDMRQPTQYAKVVLSSYAFALGFYILFCGIAYTMFGDTLLPEITQNLSTIPLFPVLAKITLVMVILSPITKYPLATFPISIFVESKLQWVPSSCRRGDRELDRLLSEPYPDLMNCDVVDQVDENMSKDCVETASLSHSSLVVDALSDVCTSENDHVPLLTGPIYQDRLSVRLLSRLIVSAIIVAVAIWIPEFHHVMALLGSFCSFGVSVLFPLICFMRLYGGSDVKDRTCPKSCIRRLWWWAGHVVLVALAACLGIWATVAAVESAFGASRVA